VATALSITSCPDKGTVRCVGQSLGGPLHLLTMIACLALAGYRRTRSPIGPPWRSSGPAWLFRMVAAGSLRCVRYGMVCEWPGPVRS
jgi:hypothetical protein